MHSDVSLTEQLASFVTSTRADSLPATAIDAAKACVLDWIGAVVAGATTEPGQILADYARSQPPGPATVIGAAAGRSAEVAALANGGASHTLEVDDAHRASFLHPGAPIIPVALALAESEENVTGTSFLTAIVLGYEAATRIGAAAGSEHYRYWHHTATCGVFGATVAAGWLLQLSATQLVWALGHAGSMAGGLWAFGRDGDMTKSLHPGRAAASGILAAQLGKRGFTGPRCVLEDERGFFAATSPKARPEIVGEALEPAHERYRIAEVTFKPYASCRHTHPAIDAGLALRAHGQFDRDHIAAVGVDTYRAAVAIAGNPAPAHPYAAKFSIAYCLAAALWRGTVSVSDFDNASLHDENLRNLMARTTVSVTPEMEARYPEEWPARVTLTFDNGEQLATEVDIPLGAPEKPLGQAALQAKFNTLMAAAGAEARAEEVIAWTTTLDQRQQLNFPLTDWAWRAS